MSAVKKELRVPKRSMKSSPEWNEMVEVTLPRARKGEDKTEFVSVNGKAYWVPRGKTVHVPVPIKAALDRTYRQREIMQDIIDQMPANEALTEM